jgi:L-ascorbate metabolism protein UlaG (beta-lactamase superfamily)
MFTTDQDNLTGIDLLLITHEHGDHLHVESVKKILENNPDIKIITNSAVGKILTKENIPFEMVEHGQNQNFKGLVIEGFGNDHKEIYKEYNLVQNTGYFIDNYLFYPGDALYNPKKPITVLALPAPGTWANIKEIIDYAIELKPQKCFPVHDGSLSRKTFMHNVFHAFLPKEGIQVTNLEENQSAEF